MKVFRSANLALNLCLFHFIHFGQAVRKIARATSVLLLILGSFRPAILSQPVRNTPLTLSQVRRFIAAGTEERVLQKLIEERHIAFLPAATVLNGLRAKGASAGTLAVITKQKQLGVAPAHFVGHSRNYDLSALCASCHLTESNYAAILFTPHGNSRLATVGDPRYIGAHPSQMDSVTVFEAAEWVLISFRIGTESGGGAYSSMVRRRDCKVLWTELTDIYWESTVTVSGNSLSVKTGDKVTRLDLRTGKAIG